MHHEEQDNGVVIELVSTLIVYNIYFQTNKPSKKRVLDSPPPEPLPPAKRSSLHLPERSEYNSNINVF